MEQIMLTLLEISASTAAVILVVLLLSPLINRNYSAKWKYWLWIVLAVRLLIPFDFSFASVPAIVEVDIPSAQVFAPAAPVFSVEAAAPLRNQESMQPSSFAVTGSRLLMLVWAAGAVLFLIWQAANYVLFRRRVLRWGLPVPKDSAIAAVQRRVEENLGIGREIPTLLCRETVSPMMIGFFRPLLILPGEEMDERSLSYIFRHELTHFKRRDVWYKALMLLANAAHWFNPAVWLMVRQADHDLEISCDASVIRGAGTEERRAYSETILAFAHRQPRPGTALSTRFYGGKRVMKERFANIFSRKKRRTGVFAFAAAVLFVLLAGGLVACGQREETQLGREEGAGGSADNFASETAVPQADSVPLTEESAGQFIQETLATLTVHEDGTASFRLPDALPVDPEGKTELMITMSATYLVGTSTFSVERFLDDATGWTGGQTYSADLTAPEGELEQVMLRVAFMTKVGQSQYRAYNADYVVLVAPFAYEQPAVVTSNLTITQDGKVLTASYITAEGRPFQIRLRLPEGVVAAPSESTDPGGMVSGLSPYAPTLIVRNGETIGSFCPVLYGTTNAEDLAVIDPSVEDFPMQVYSPIALSSMVDWGSEFRTSFWAGDSSSVVCHPVSEEGVIADFVLAYDLNSEPYFLCLSLEPGALTQDELEALALSVSFSSKSSAAESGQ